MKKILLFDCDGVLGDTERHGHLPAFNLMWQAFDVPWQWTEEQYGTKLKIGGGKERIRLLFDDPDFLAVYAPPVEEDERDALIRQWHKKKTELYTKIIASGQIPPRPGVRRVVRAALDAGWVLGVTSTSAKESVEAVLNHAVGSDTTARFSILLAGDMVTKKKPDPEIYLTAAERLGVEPAQCVVVEDSDTGYRAVRAAGMHAVITVNGYTRNEPFEGAELVVSCLGDPDGEQSEVLANRCGARVAGYVTLADLEKAGGYGA